MVLRSIQDLGQSAMTKTAISKPSNGHGGVAACLGKQPTPMRLSQGDFALLGRLSD